MPGTPEPPAPGRPPPGAPPAPGADRPCGVPDFCVVGQPKAGTTALYEMLRGHPAIYMPAVKEPMFFARDLGRRANPPSAHAHPRTPEAYRRLFDGARPDQMTGEASSFYLFSHEAAAGIAEANPHARIVAIFREPASFLHSLHQQLRQDHLETARTLGRGLALEAPRREGRRIPRRCYRPEVLRYSEHVRYTEQLGRFHAVLPPSQILVIVYDDFAADNDATVRRIFAFLGVDRSVAVPAVRANPTVAVRSQALDELVHQVSVGRGGPAAAAKRAAHAVLPAATRRALRDTVTSRLVYGNAPAPDPALMATLRSWLRPEVERFGEYVGRDLVSQWGYGDA